MVNAPDSLEAVLFDLDGTLLEHDQDSDEVVAAAFERAGIEPFCDGDALQAAAASVSNEESDRALYRRAYKLAAQRHDGPTDRAEAFARALEQVLEPGAVSFRPGAERALATARRSYRVGMVTNGNPENQQVKLESLGIPDAFDVEVYAGQATPPKPDPDPFHAALEALEVAPSTAYYVGNTLAEDVLGAKRAGVHVGWFPLAADSQPNPSVEGHRPDHVFDSLTDLAALLERSARA